MNENQWRDKIDDYETSIHAIVGFANFYVWDPIARNDRSGVTVFQGRRLKESPQKEPLDEMATENLEDPAVDSELHAPSEADESAPSCDLAKLEDITTNDNDENQGKRSSFVTPDLGIVDNRGDGVLAEIKISFPRDETHWLDDFEQLMSYDAEFDNWPTSTGTVPRHDIVLLTEQGRANKVRKYYEKNLGKTIDFARPFVIVSCNRSDNRQPYYFFQNVSGTLSSPEVEAQLEDGTKVPMKVLVDRYSTVKIYDAEPPLPYMSNLIWSYVVHELARDAPKYNKLRKRQKLPVLLDVDEIIRRLREGFTFRSIAIHASDGTPTMPYPKWVQNGLELMVANGDAEWIDATKTSIRVFFQMLEDPLDHFIKACITRDDAPPSSNSGQLPLPFSD